MLGRLCATYLSLFFASIMRALALSLLLSPSSFSCLRLDPGSISEPADRPTGSEMLDST